MESARVILENVARALSETSNRKVVFRGNECATDGKILYLPSLPDMVPENIVVMLRGHLDHELSHCLFSDFSVVKGVSGVRFAALNSVEDVWCETAMCRRYPGCSVNLEALVDYVIENTLRKQWEDLSPFNQVLDLFIIGARYGMSHPFVEEFGGMFSKELDMLKPEMQLARSAKSTSEALKIADSILDKLKERDRKQQEEQNGKKEKAEKADSGQCGHSAESDDVKVGAEEPEGKQGEGSTGGEKEAPVENKPGRPGDDKVGEAGEDKGQDKVEDNHGSLVSGEDDQTPSSEFPSSILPSSVDPSSMVLPTTVQEMIKNEVKDLHGYRPYTTENDKFEPYPINSQGLVKYNKIKDGLNGLPAVLKGKLHRLLMGQKRSRWIGGKRSGFLDPSMAAHVVFGTQDNVFRDRHEGRKMNTAVSILCDLSGSMSNNRKMQKEREALVLLCESISAIGSVPFEVLGFTGDSKKTFKGAAKEFARWGSLDIYYVKRFEDPFGMDQRSRVGSLTSMYENYDGESVMVAANRLLARKEGKKVLCVLSDGYPHCQYGNHGYLNPHLKSVTKRLESIPDFHLLAFGILTNDPSKFYRNFVHVDNLEELPMSIMSVFYKILVSS